ncbi:MAG: pyruvate carboxylase, partial [Chromatiales bacterium]|nr:pyruvate carboxylase [Chromatiales bacterium]
MVSEKPIKKLLIANRSEIAIRIFRTAKELDIDTVAIYTHEDRYALHRFKADEAYQIGPEGEPIKSYLDIDGIIAIALDHEVDAIHSGYGFLAENPAFAKACADNNIIFIGPSVDALEQLGDKTSAREIAAKAGIPVSSGSSRAIETPEAGLELSTTLGYPVILKASHGGGGRGMRIVRRAEDFISTFEEAQSESLSAFGSPDIFVEKFVEHARHIEVQIMGDQHDNLVHLYERDCSVQRRYQKVVEIAPAPQLDSKLQHTIHKAALAIGHEVGYSNAGTVEFLVDANTDQFFFIEVNPRIQVEHTVTEEVTGFDLIKCQILAAKGLPLSSEEIGLGNQEDIHTNGFALQCRITTEDPTNNFMPDYGRLIQYRPSGGPGIRLDAGNAYQGAVVNPYYDSMLVKVTARGQNFIDAIKRMRRALREFRIGGVKTNIHFLENILNDEYFVSGGTTTRFIDESPQLFKLPEIWDQSSRILHFIGDTIVNGNDLVAGRERATRRRAATLPIIATDTTTPLGSRDLFKNIGAEKYSKWITEQQRLFITDTTMRDAHQSLLATRLRSHDMLNIADAYSKLTPELFSLEMWGGATFDSAMRFLKESPWQRLEELRAATPNILFQMLVRASSAVGYSNYPDNLVQAFIKESAAGGIDLFRVFDALNWVPNMRVAMEAVLEAGALCEASICYSGDLLNPERTKYDLKYYIDLAKELESMGAHILAIKDMAGLCKPEAARLLVTALKQEVDIPIHFHTHDTSGIAAASVLAAAEAGVDIIDAALAPLSGGTSQPNLNTLVEALNFSPRNTTLNPDHLDSIADYWRSTREFYTPFESSVLPATADLYRHEIPGGQYTNLYQQARALGLADQWRTICSIYTEVNQMFGDIIKVTPTSKAVGDMALFMVANNLSTDDVLDAEQNHDFPASVIDLIGGMMGRPIGGFPEEVKQRILNGREEMEGRPGDSLEPADFDSARDAVKQLINSEPTQQQLISYLLYPKVFEAFTQHQSDYSDTSRVPTPVFLYGLEPDEEVSVEINKGKSA